MMGKVIILSGGIGAGKSMVSRILRLCGYTVYDCDYEAKRLMDQSPEFIESLSKRFGKEYILPDGLPDRKLLAEKVFSDKEALSWLNGRVHSMVKEDILRKINEEILFVESAIPVVSGLLEIADAVWWVDAPEEQRAERAAARGNVPVETIFARMKAQEYEYSGVINSQLPVTIIDNADNVPMLDNIKHLLNEIDL